MTPGREAALRDLLTALRDAIRQGAIPEADGILAGLINGPLDHAAIHEAAWLLRHETSTWGQVHQAVTR